MRIGIAGIGRCGAAIAQRLMAAGHEVTVWNRSADKLRPVTDAGAIDAVYNGLRRALRGLLAGGVEGALVSWLRRR